MPDDDPEMADGPKNDRVPPDQEPDEPEEPETPPVEGDLVR